MTKKLDVKEPSIKVRSSYIDQTTFYNFSQANNVSGEILSQMISSVECKDSFRYINTIALKEQMYPKKAFNALSYCDLANIRCIILGGMPQQSRIESWTGSAFSYNSGDNISQGTIFTDKLQEDLGKVSTYSNIISDNCQLQESGILLMHDVLSVTRSQENILKVLWRPIIGYLLSYLLYNDPEIPVVFTNMSSMVNHEFSSISAKNKFCLNGGGSNHAFPASPSIFDVVEAICNRGVLHMADRISFIDLISK
jgi:uracil DNA glycosylase